MKNKIDVSKISWAYNKVRDEFKDGVASPSEMKKMLMEKGLSENMSLRLINHSPFFKVTQKSVTGQKGNFREVRFSDPKVPTHQSLFENWLKKPVEKKKEIGKQEKEIEIQKLSFEEECCSFLKEKGFKVAKPVFDKERFAADYPDLYKKYIYYTPC